MPRGDRTGPAGAGPMTGRGAGLCRGNDLPGYCNAGSGRRQGGRRRGFRRMFLETGIPGWMRFNDHPAASQKDTVELLKSQAKFLRTSLDAVNKRLSELESDTDAS